MNERIRAVIEEPRRFKSFGAALAHSVECGGLAVVEVSKGRVHSSGELQALIASHLPTAGREIVDLADSCTSEDPAVVRFDASGTLDKFSEHPGKPWHLHIVWDSRACSTP